MGEFDSVTRDVLASVQHAFDAFNRGDMAAFGETWSDQVIAIINEASPHVWTGDRALGSWLGDSGKESEALEVPEHDRRIALKNCLKAKISADHAFLVLEVTMSFVRGDQRIEEDGIQISRLTRSDGQWKVAALAYGGGLATRVTPT